MQPRPFGFHEALLEQYKTEAVYNEPRHIGRNLNRIIGTNNSDNGPDDPFDGHDSLLYCHVPALLRYSLPTSTSGTTADFGGGSGDVVGGADLGAIAYAASAGMILGLHHANMGDGTVALLLKDLNERCPIRFTTELLDKGGSGLDAVTALTEMVTRSPSTTTGSITSHHQQPCAVLGAHVSSASSKLASLAAVFDLPVVSSSAMSPDLNDAKQYPTFLRTHTDVNGFGRMAVSFLTNNLGIRKFGLLYTNDGYGFGFSRSVLEAAADAKVEVVGGGVPYLPPSTNTKDAPSQGVNENDEMAELRAALKALADTGCNYFVADFYAESFATIMALAAEYDLAGPGKFWLISGTADMAPFILGGALKLAKDSKAAKAIQGNGLYFCEGGVPGLGGPYDTFTRIWAGLDEQALSYINRKQPTRADGSQYAFSTEFFAKRPHHVVTFSYDAAVGIALSACEAWEKSNQGASSGNINGDRSLASTIRGSRRRHRQLGSVDERLFSGRTHHALFANSSYQGASGKIVFRESFPTRTAESSYFVMANLQDVELNSTHVHFRGSPIVKYFETDKSKWKTLANNQWVYPDGSTTPPIEMVPSDNGWSLGKVVGITIVLAIIPMALIGFFFYKSEKRKQERASLWLIKASELHFDDPPVVIGQGTFGLVLLAEYRGTQVAVKRVIPARSKMETRESSTACPGERRRRRSNDSDRCEFSSKFDSADDSTSNNLGLMSGAQKTLKSTMFNKPGAGKKSTMVALKTAMVGKGDSYSRLKSHFMEEIQQASRLRHPCICTVMGTVIDANREPTLVMEYMQMGSLFGLLHNKTVLLSGEMLLPILRDVAKGLRFLHAADPPVVHGDLKSGNILVDSRFHAKVADFGLSQKKKVGAVGTPFWMAPELLRGESENTCASDVYSFGIVLYEAYARKVPYEGEDYEEVIKLIADPKVQKRPLAPPHCPSQIQSLMTDCFVDNASERPTFEELDMRLHRLAAESINPDEAYHSLQMKKESKRTNEIFYDNFPKNFADALREGRKVEPESRECVTIFFSDIVGFTDIASTLTPLKVSNMLDRLYNKFDGLSHKHDIFKVETIGDAYMAVTNLVKDQPDHAKRIADFAIEALKAANDTAIDEDNTSLGCVNIRVGLHSGPVVANVVGSRNLKFSIFGDSVNVAARMESNSQTNRIHCSECTARLLRKQAPEIPVRRRGKIDIKGKGMMTAFWVNEMSTSARRGSDCSVCSSTSTDSRRPLQGTCLIVSEVQR